MVLEDRRNFVIQNLKIARKKIIQRLSLEYILLGDKMQLGKIVENRKLLRIFRLFFICASWRLFFFTYDALGTIRITVTNIQHSIRWDGTVINWRTLRCRLVEFLMFNSAFGRNRRLIKIYHIFITKLGQFLR